MLCGIITWLNMLCLKYLLRDALSRLGFLSYAGAKHALRDYVGCRSNPQKARSGMWATTTALINLAAVADMVWADRCRPICMLNGKQFEMLS
jgi:hypothetical protein